MASDYQLYQGDCLGFMKTLKAGSVDAVITDPPYGIGEHGGACRTRGKPGYSKHENKGWDNKTPNKNIFDMMRIISRNQIIFGGNYFSDKLPCSPGWIYWRKLMGGDFADGELAWTSLNIALREFTKCPKGIDKVHPCEKPIELMRWCVELISKPGDTIADFFMGSGTTGVACMQLGRRFIGCEIDPDYFKIAERRISQAAQQPSLFETESKPQAVALELAL